MILRAAGSSLVVVACVIAASCASVPRSGQSQAGASTLPAEEIQAEIMAFADSYTAMMNQAANRVT